MARTLLIDLDGTLVDTVPDLTASLNRLMAARGLPHLTRAQVAAMVGDGLAALTTKAFAAIGRTSDEDAVADLGADYRTHVAVESTLYPGALQALQMLADQGWRMAVCTNKPEQAARELLGVMGLLPLLCAVGGGDSFPTRKPDPGHLLATLSQAGGRPDAAVMLGDHRNDMAAAAAAGIPSIFAAWGYGAPAMAEGSAATARDFADAARIVNALLPQG